MTVAVSTIHRFYVESGGGIQCRQQQPDNERTYFEKDILRVGIWETQAGTWEVTHDTIQKLVRNFQLAQSRGNKVPVVWNHSRDARDQIGHITKLFARNDTLFAVFWASDPEDIKRLGKTVDEVSVEASEDWEDGHGNQYDIIITHLGVVNLPVVTNQGNFKRLSLAEPDSDSGTDVLTIRLKHRGYKHKKKKKNKRMAEMTPQEALKEFEKGKGNPPAWVAEEAKWDKAKRAAKEAKADDEFAFAVFFYLEVLDGKKKAKKTSLHSKNGNNVKLKLTGMMKTGLRSLAKTLVSKRSER